MVVHRNFHKLIKVLTPCFFFTLSGMKGMEDRNLKAIQYQALPAANGKVINSDLISNGQ